MNNQSPTISFVIPAFNEQAIIAATLQAIQRHVTAVDYEIIVVDNGSTDETSRIAMQYGAKVVFSNSKTIAGVRNDGVKQSSGKVLVFIDADVLVTEQWNANIAGIMQFIDKTPMIVTGSRCLPPDSTGWLNKHWFLLLLNTKASYINSGHLITTKKAFDAVGGFSAELNTAEDFDFCQKARSLGAAIREEPALVVTHEGYPVTITEFVMRERWHGREDFETLPSLFSSKVALLALIHFMALVAVFLGMIVSKQVLIWVFCYLLASGILCAVLSIIKFQYGNIPSLLQTSVIFYLYFIGRTLSLVDRIFRRRAKRFRE